LVLAEQDEWQDVGRHVLPWSMTADTVSLAPRAA
jgi:hypothetical protein